MWALSTDVLQLTAFGFWPQQFLGRAWLSSTARSLMWLCPALQSALGATIAQTRLRRSVALHLNQIEQKDAAQCRVEKKSEQVGAAEIAGTEQAERTIGEDEPASQYNRAIRTIPPATPASGPDSIRAKTIPPKPRAAGWPPANRKTGFVQLCFPELSREPATRPPSLLER